jgi:hypothetical protein
MHRSDTPRSMLLAGDGPGVRGSSRARSPALVKIEGTKTSPSLAAPRESRSDFADFDGAAASASRGGQKLSSLATVTASQKLDAPCACAFARWQTLRVLLPMPGEGQMSSARSPILTQDS